MSECVGADFCPCTRDCPRHGNCAACVANHRTQTPGFPACFFTKEGEAWHDRSYTAMLRDLQENRGIRLQTSEEK